MNQAVIVLGGGSHAKVIVDALRLSSANIIGLVDPHVHEATRFDVAVLGDDDAVLAYPSSDVRLVNGVGSTPGKHELRVRLFDSFRSRGYCFEHVVHPSAIIAGDVVLDEGVQVMAGCVLQPAVRVGCNSIINTRASIDHDCILGEHVHIAPGVTLSGNVCVEDGAHLGTGAAIIDGVTIGRGAVIGVGAAVFKNIGPGETVLARCEIRS